MTEFSTPKGGLTSAEAIRRQAIYGKNELTPQKQDTLFKKIIHIICEPMFLLLIAAAVIYFLLGEPRDGAIMLIFVVGIISIDVIQEWKTDRTLSALKNLSAPQIAVIRDGSEQIIPSTNLVPGDLMTIYEGVKIPADGTVIQCSDLCVDESSLTGETEGVWKTVKEQTDTAGTVNSYWKTDYCYAGTLVIQGHATILVEQTGSRTEYGKIGKAVASAPDIPTPLQRQMGNLVRLCAGIAALLFTLVGLFTYLNLSGQPFHNRIIQSILSGITLAMAMIPEEFPVILTVFLSMGAWRLARKNSLVRKLPSVETLGSVSVLCVDKTGTITMNRMEVQDILPFHCEVGILTETLGLACETEAYDPMEQAILQYCGQNGYPPSSLFDGRLVTEYAFTNQLKMMGHIWERNGTISVSAKGSPESILSLCSLKDSDRELISQSISQMSGYGLRVLAIATQMIDSTDAIPPSITDCHLTLLGLIGLADPPREHLKEDIEVCQKAGIRVVMITGDNGITASAIAQKVGMEHCGTIITGEMLNTMSDGTLKQAVNHACIFSRVVPEHKMRIVKALKENGETVAMTGDGVNDAPALKYADIGIAMGKRGSEVSREAADLVLMDDNFTTIVDTIRDGRRIYDNIRKAVGYIFTIHIPIAFASLLGPLLGIPSTALLLLPLHIVLMELVIDPTCSIVLERQPEEADIMARPPRTREEKLLNFRILSKSILQGMVMFAASFGTYYTVLGPNSENAPTARAMGLSIMILGNLFLVQVNSSNRDYAWHSLRVLAKDRVMWLVVAGTLLMVGTILYTPLHHFLKLAPLSPPELLISVIIAALSVFWYESVKLFKKLKNNP